MMYLILLIPANRAKSPGFRVTKIKLNNKTIVYE